MRTSSYIIYVKLLESKEYLLVHGYTGAIDLLKPNVMVVLRSEKLVGGMMAVKEHEVPTTTGHL